MKDRISIITQWIRWALWEMLMVIANFIEPKLSAQDRGTQFHDYWNDEVEPLIAEIARLDVEIDRLKIAAGEVEPPEVGPVGARAMEHEEALKAEEALPMTDGVMLK